MTTPILSAIVSTYNAERFMRGCLEDLLAQTIAGRMEIVVVDACSPQREGDIVRELAATHPNIRYIRAETRETVYASWNRGIQNARGKYVTSANTDDRHRKDGLERLVDTLERDPGAALAYADVVITFQENETFDEASKVFSYAWPELDRRRLFEVCAVGPQPVWRRELHDRYGWFDPAFTSAGDYEFWLRLGVRERFVHIPELLGLYLAAPGSVEHQNLALSTRESEAARLRYWDDAWGTRPRPHGFFLHVHAMQFLRRLARLDVSPLREGMQHARMIVKALLSR
jgi:glycosyltransferase involved in cell wall biosynthesis